MSSFETNELRLPNEKAVLAIGILSFVAICCTGGVLTVVGAVLGIIYANMDLSLYASAPENYSADTKKRIQAGRFICILSLGLGLFSISAILIEIVTGKGWILSWLTQLASIFF